MTLTLTPEQEAFVESEMREGAFSSADEVLAAALFSFAQAHSKLPPAAPRTHGVRAKNLADLLSEYPWAGSDLDITRDQSPPRDLDL
jgi:Arc/MetJ-type ribon-helix-helix transcriptional regulator